MKQASLPLYIRFGEIPPYHLRQITNKQVDRNEVGIDVWKAIQDYRCYYPIMPEEPNKETVSNYFEDLLHSKSKVYLVTGREVDVETSDKEIILTDVVIIKEITHYYRK